MKKVILCLVFLCGFLACSSEDDTPQVIAPIATPKPLASQSSKSKIRINLSYI